MCAMFNESHIIKKNNGLAIKIIMLSIYNSEEEPAKPNLPEKLARSSLLGSSGKNRLNKAGIISEKIVVATLTFIRDPPRQSK